MFSQEKIRDTFDQNLFGVALSHITTSGCNVYQYFTLDRQKTNYVLGKRHEPNEPIVINGKWKWSVAIVTKEMQSSLFLKFLLRHTHSCVRAGTHNSLLLFLT